MPLPALMGDLLSYGLNKNFFFFCRDLYFEPYSFGVSLPGRRFGILTNNCSGKLDVEAATSVALAAIASIL
jgi:hypothetical protein